MHGCSNLPQPYVFSKKENDHQKRDRVYLEFIRSLNNNFTYKQKNIRLRDKPIEDGKLQAFFHVISEEKNINGVKMRFYKAERLERCNLIKPILECFEKCPKCVNTCKIRVWTAPYGNLFRTKFYFEELEYIVIIEERKNTNDYILVTAYVVDRNDRKNDLLREYNKYKNL